MKKKLHSRKQKVTLEPSPPIPMPAIDPATPFGDLTDEVIALKAAVADLQTTTSVAPVAIDPSTVIDFAALAARVADLEKRVDPLVAAAA